MIYKQPNSRRVSLNNNKDDIILNDNTNKSISLPFASHFITFLHYVSLAPGWFCLDFDGKPHVKKYPGRMQKTNYCQ